MLQIIEQGIYRGRATDYSDYFVTIKNVIFSPSEKLLSHTNKLKKVLRFNLIQNEKSQIAPIEVLDTSMLNS